MNSKKIELDAAKEKLSKLIEDLDKVEREFDKANEHSAHYMGNDQTIEKGRDEKARNAYERMAGVKEEIVNQTKLIETLVNAY